jgi:tetratricopeptide (TPR) repeat protein
MRNALALVVLAALGTGIAPAQQVNKEALKQAARLPRISLFTGVKCSEEGYGLLGERLEPDLEIAALRKALKDDASDAERHLRLSQLYLDAHDQRQAQEAAAKAVEQFRQRLKTQPNSGALLAQLGQALDLLGKRDDAETTLRQAVKAAPDDYHCWLPLGKFLTCRAVDVLLGSTDKRDAVFDFEKTVQLAAAGKLAKDAAAQADKLLEEARGCYDRAVKQAPRESQVYTQRALWRMQGNQVRVVIRFAQGNKANPDAADCYFTADGLADLKEAARCSPNDHRALGMCIMYEAMFCSGRPGQVPVGPGKRDLWDSLPEARRKDLQESIARLEKLTQGKEARAAAGASEVMGFLRVMLLGDFKAGQAALRRAVTLDASRESAWDLLTGVMVYTSDSDAIVALCQDRIKVRDCARSRFLTAKAYESGKKPDKAEQELRAALKLEPGHFLANLGLAALLLRKGEAAQLTEAAKLLDKAEQVLGKEPPKGELNKLRLVRGIYLGLTGDGASAVKVIQQVSDTEPGNPDARAALAALGK